MWETKKFSNLATLGWVSVHLHNPLNALQDKGNLPHRTPHRRVSLLKNTARQELGRAVTVLSKHRLRQRRVNTDGKSGIDAHRILKKLQDSSLRTCWAM